MHCPRGQTRPHGLSSLAQQAASRALAYSAKWARTRRGHRVAARNLEAAGPGRYWPHSQDRWGSARGAGGGHGQDTELADIMRQQVLAARRESMARHSRERRRAARYAISAMEVSRHADWALLLPPLFGHAPISLRMTRDVVEYVLRVAVRDKATLPEVPSRCVRGKQRPSLRFGPVCHPRRTRDR